jgi:hypothetical protein
MYEKQKKRDLNAVLLAARRANRDHIFTELRRGKEVREERSQLKQSTVEDCYLRVRDNMSEKEQQLAVLTEL